MTALIERPLSVTRDRPPAQHRVQPTKPRFWTTDRLLGVALATFGAVIVGRGVNLFPALLGDEGIYTNQAQSVLHGEISPYTYTYDHPFLGWLQLAPLQGLVRLVVGDEQLTVVSGRLVMVAYCFATLMFSFHIARRMEVRRSYAVVAVLLLAMSPLFVSEARTVLLDNIALPWVLGAFYLALNPQRRQWTYGASAVLFAIGVLSKETVVLLLPALVYLVWTRAYRPIRQMALAVFVTLGVLVLAVYPLFALLRNELLPGPGHVSLWSDGIMYQLADRKGSGTIWQPGSARRSLVDSWLSGDAALLLGGLSAGVACLFVRRLRFVGLALVMWAVPVIKPGGYLPQMYVVVAIPLCALAIVGLFDAVTNGLSRLGKPRFVRVATGLVGAVAAVSAMTYYVPQLRDITTDRGNDQVAVTATTETYLRRILTPKDNTLVDPSYWADLSTDGFDEPWQRFIAYYQFDLDPLSSKRYLPNGWQDIDYVVETAEMRDNVESLGLANLKKAIANSTVVARFGEGRSAVSVREVRATPYNQGATR